MKVKRYIDINSQTRLLHEITGLRFIPMNIPELLAFCNLSFSIQLSGKSQGDGLGSNRPPENQVDDTSEGRRENKSIVMERYATVFEFDRAIATSMICEKKKSTARGRKD